MAKQHIYLCIDLKSFYASVECVERGLDPMTTNLVVADPERSDKTICLAITPAMKSLGIRNRCRVFEIPKNIEYIMAPPRMQKYIDYAAEIYGIYLKYISKDDIHVYSIDEAFLDITSYLPIYGLTAKEMAIKLMAEIMNNVGVPATCGIGTNLYLAKIALDITAKHSPDFIGYLDEESYRRTLWEHRPITDFWRVGTGIATRLEKLGIHTMGQVAQANEEMLYKEFGIDAELLIDHAWGREPTTIADIKAYKPKNNSLTSGQVLMRDYSFEEGRLIIREMMDLMCLDLVDKDLVTGSVTIYVGYSNVLKAKPAKGTISFGTQTNANSIIIPAVVSLYERVVDRNKPIRRVNITCNKVVPTEAQSQQLSLFDNVGEDLERNYKIQKAVLDVKKKYGKNTIIKAMDLEEAATTIERNRQIGGHKSGE
ncbi:MAG: DNA repair protein [Clostridia bacterium]|nr:DNA repair protein [Clostridia bacterium]